MNNVVAVDLLHTIIEKVIIIHGTTIVANRGIPSTTIPTRKTHACCPPHGIANRVHIPFSLIDFEQNDGFKDSR